MPQCCYSVEFMLWMCSIKEELCATVLLFSSVFVVDSGWPINRVVRSLLI